MDCKHDVLTSDGRCFTCNEMVVDYRPIYNTDTKKHVGYLKTERVPEVFGMPS